MPRTNTRPSATNFSKKRAASREDGQARKRPHIDGKPPSKLLKSKTVKNAPAESSEQKLPRRKNPVTAVAVDENESQSDEGDELELGDDEEVEERLV